MNRCQQFIKKIKTVAPYIQSEFEVKSMRIFGSIARGDDHEDSDLDIFVEMPPKGLKVVGLKQFLQELVGIKVDIIRSYPNLDRYLTSEIEKDGITIFAD